jgi:hypothetical protein
MALEICTGNHSVVSQYRLCCDHGADRASSPFSNIVSIVYISMCYILLGGMDTQKHWHGG